MIFLWKRRCGCVAKANEKGPFYRAAGLPCDRHLEEFHAHVEDLARRRVREAWDEPFIRLPAGKVVDLGWSER